MTQILVVENSQMIRTMYIAGLISYGYAVKAVETVREAREVLASGYRPSVILLDLYLSGEPGQALIEYVDTTLGRNEMKIIVASGSSLSKEDIARLNADYFLAKPVELVDLLNLVQSLAPT